MLPDIMVQRRVAVTSSQRTKEGDRDCLRNDIP